MVAILRWDVEPQVVQHNPTLKMFDWSLAPGHLAKVRCKFCRAFGSVVDDNTILMVRCIVCTGKAEELVRPNVEVQQKDGSWRVENYVRPQDVRDGRLAQYRGIQNVEKVPNQPQIPFRPSRFQGPLVEAGAIPSYSYNSSLVGFLSEKMEEAMDLKSKRMGVDLKDGNHVVFYVGKNFGDERVLCLQCGGQTSRRMSECCLTCNCSKTSVLDVVGFAPFGMRAPQASEVEESALVSDLRAQLARLRASIASDDQRVGDLSDQLGTMKSSLDDALLRLKRSELENENLRDKLKRAGRK